PGSRRGPGTQALADPPAGKAGCRSSIPELRRAVDLASVRSPAPTQPAPVKVPRPEPESIVVRSAADEAASPPAGAVEWTGAMLAIWPAGRLAIQLSGLAPRAHELDQQWRSCRSAPSVTRRQQTIDSTETDCS